jgi:hypothetical protein
MVAMSWSPRASLRARIGRVTPGRRAGRRLVHLSVGLLTAAWLLGLVYVSVATVQPPPVPRAAPADEFSAQRAMRYVQKVAAQPHAIGSPQQTSVRDAIVAWLRSFGLAPEVRPVELVSAIDNHVAARVYDIIARLPGSGAPAGAAGAAGAGPGPGRSIVLAAHYDSVATAQGAADDGTGVATLLEVARALRAGAPLKNDVVFLFTDAEERGMMGAQAFVHSAWARNVGLVLNFDSPGSSGPALMYQTSAGNGRLIAEFARAAPQPFASSLMYEAVRGRVIYNDFSVFRAAHLPGLSFALTEGFFRNHTALDNVDTLDPKALQHMGTTALALTRHFGDLRLDRLSSRDVVYFNPLGFHLVVYSQGVAVALVVIAALAFAGVVWLGLRKSRLTAAGMFSAAFASPFVCAISAGVVAVWWMVARSWYVQPGYPGVMLYNDNLHRAGLVALVFGVAAWLFFSLLKGLRPFDVMAGTLAWWLVLAAVSLAAAPGASYLFVWPLLAALAALAIVLQLSGKAVPRSFHAAVPGPRTLREEASFVGDLAALRRPLPWLVLCLGAAPGVILLASSTYVFLISVGLRMAGTVAAVWLVMPLLAPLLAPLARGRHWLAPLAITMLGLGILIGISPRAGFDRSYPRQNTVFYRYDGGTRTAVWGTFDPQIDSWTQQFLGQHPQRRFDAAYIPYRGYADYYTAPAPAFDVPAPVVTILSDRLVPGGRELLVHVRSVRGAPLLSFALESIAGNLTASVDGLPISAGYTTELDGTPVRWRFDYLDLPPGGIDIRMVMQAGGAMRLRAIDLSYGLPPAFAYRPRPITMMAGGAGDMTLGQTVVDVPAAPRTAAAR